MFRRWCEWVWKFLNRPMFGTRIIPPNARVNPDVLPEHEYPIYCEQCDYLLRGLPDGRCPECGTPFERGRLLVEQYVTEPLRRQWDRQRSGRWAARFAAAGLGVLGLWCAGNYAFAWWGSKLPMFQYDPNNPRAMSNWFARLNMLSAGVWFVEVFILFMLLIFSALAWRVYRQNAYRRKRVVDAIFESPRT